MCHNDHPQVAILMSTYNGDLYLKEQVDSILNQSYPNIKLIVRDDGSSDNSLNILKNYSDKLTLLTGENVGCKSSFYNLAQYTYKYLTDSKYIAFSDQDDYWLPDKIRSAIDKLKQYDDLDIPLLYICPATLVDKFLNPIPVKKKKNYKYTLEESMMLGVCAGCTMVFNRKLLELFVRANPTDMYLHDDWIYKVCLICNGKLYVDKNSYILYRQHGNNVVGGHQGMLSAWKRRFKMFTEGSVRSSKAKALLRIYPDSISTEAREVLNDISCYSNSLRCKIHILFSKKYRTSNWIYNAIFKAALIFNRF